MLLFDLLDIFVWCLLVFALIVAYYLCLLCCVLLCKFVKCCCFKFPVGALLVVDF